MKNSLRLIRQKKGVSLRTLAERIGIAHQTIANYEMSEKPLNAEFLTKAAEALDVTEDDLAAFPDDPRRAFRVFSWTQLQRLLAEEYDTVKSMSEPKTTDRFRVVSDLAGELQFRCDATTAEQENAVPGARASLTEEPARKGLISAAEKLAQEPMVGKGRSRRGA
jgi:transcriptional regulator with XRE-family HTH domain